MSDAQQILLAAIYSFIGLIIGALGKYIVDYFRNRQKVNDATSEAVAKIKKVQADSVAEIETSKANLVKVQQDAQAESVQLREDMNRFFYNLAQDLIGKQDKMNERLQQVVQEANEVRERNATLTGQLTAISARADSSEKQAAETQRLIGVTQSENSNLKDEINGLREARRSQDAANAELRRKVDELTTNLSHMVTVQENTVKTRDAALAERDTALKEVSGLKLTIATQTRQIEELAAKNKTLEQRVTDLESELRKVEARATQEAAPVLIEPKP